MTPVSRVLVRVGAQAVLVACLSAGVPAPAHARVEGSARAQAANPQAVQLKEFQDRLAKYLQLRSDLAKKLKPLSPTADAAQLAARQESLAAALREVRTGARRGDLIPPAVDALIRATVADDLRRRQPSERRAAFQEVPDAAVPVINNMYPAKAALPTVPPLLLKNLPLLPDNLQYRFFGRHMVILDGDTQIIVDYMTDVLPPH